MRWRGKAGNTSNTTLLNHLSWAAKHLPEMSQTVSDRFSIRMLKMVGRLLISSFGGWGLINTFTYPLFRSLKLIRIL